MGVFVVKQPNSLYCLYSTYVDTIVCHNMTREDYINFKKEEAEEEAKTHLDRIDKGKAWGVPNFEKLIENFIPREMSIDEFVKIVRESGYNGDLSKYCNLNISENDQKK